MEPGTSFTEASGTTSGALAGDPARRNARLHRLGLEHRSHNAVKATHSAATSTPLKHCWSRAPAARTPKTTAAASFTNEGTITTDQRRNVADNSATLTDLRRHPHQQRQNCHRSRRIGGTRTLARQHHEHRHTLDQRHHGLQRSGRRTEQRRRTQRRRRHAAGRSRTGARSRTAAAAKSPPTGKRRRVHGPRGTFTEGAGTTNGTKPVILDDARARLHRLRCEPDRVARLEAH